MFEINENSNIIIENFLDSKIYTIDNFFKNPNEIVVYLEENNPKIHKDWELPSCNTVEFFEGRHYIEHDSVLSIQKKLIELCGSKSIPSNKIYSNIAKFFSKEFNDYKNHYWWPHRDDGWNALIYLNKKVIAGTNLYEEVSNDQECMVNKRMREHDEPWRKKENYKIIKTLESSYNKMILFDGKKFLHNMAIVDDTFFNERRMNLAMFF